MYSTSSCPVVRMSVRSEQASDRRRFLEREIGQSLIELALVLPVLILLLAGIVDLGRAFHDYVILTNAIMQGARYGSNYPTDSSGIRARILSETSGTNVSIRPEAITITYPNGSSSGNPIRVAVSFQFNAILGGILGVNMFTISNTVDSIIL